MTQPFLFDEFFASGRDESISPFLTPESRSWGKHLPLKVALLSALLLLASFVTSFFLPPLSHLLLLFVYFLAGTPALLGSIEDLKNLEINIDTLMTLAALLSVIIGSGMEGALLLVLFEISGTMEQLVSRKTTNTLLHLNRLSPRSACLIDDTGMLVDTAIREVAIGALLLIKAGEIVPLDGIVVKGNSFVNLVHLTGESLPVAKQGGDEVQAGCYNLDGTLTIRVTRASHDSTLSRIIHLITEAQEAKPRLERLFDRFGRGYAITIMALFLLFALTFPWIFSLPYFGTEGSLYRSLSFLVAASPCALIIATPTAYLSAINSCAKRGILLKGGVVLDALARCKVIAFDKTGTLTTGELHCTSIEPLSPSPYTLEEALSVAASLEQNAVHPIAKAIAQKAPTLIPLLSFRAIAGHGLEGSCLLQGRTLSVAIGQSDFVLNKLPQELRPTTPLQKQGQIHTLLLIGEALFSFHFTDTVRPQSQPLISQLKQRWRTLMLSGDHIEIAESVAREVGIHEVYAHLRPEDKLHKVSQLADTEGLVMVGDGVNDAPALARATVGISMGKIGSATAIDASDVVFLSDDLFLLEWLLNKSHKTLSIIKQNITLALIVILFASIPALLGFIPLWAAVLLHEGGTLLVGLNSLRLLGKS
jgi:heavy metal translocating P-type ATPase